MFVITSAWNLEKLISRRNAPSGVFSVAFSTSMPDRQVVKHAVMHLTPDRKFVKSLIGGKKVYSET